MTAADRLRLLRLAEAPHHAGAAGALVRTVEQAARDAGQATLWLYTSTARSLYLRLGWQDAFRTRVKDTTVDVMRRDLALAPLPPAA
jgi:GNAT superfamily N-acetyltransferase